MPRPRPAAASAGVTAYIHYGGFGRLRRGIGSVEELEGGRSGSSGHRANRSLSRTRRSNSGQATATSDASHGRGVARKLPGRARKAPISGRGDSANVGPGGRAVTVTSDQWRPNSKPESRASVNGRRRASCRGRAGPGPVGPDGSEAGESSSPLRLGINLNLDSECRCAVM